MCKGNFEGGMLSARHIGWFKKQDQQGIHRLHFIHAVHSHHPLPDDRWCGLSYFMSEEDRATDIGSMHKKIAFIISEISSWTDRQTDRHTHRNTCYHSHGQSNNSFTTESELWRNAGPSASLLQETMLKSDKIWCIYLVINCVGVRTFWIPLVCTLHLWEFINNELPTVATFIQLLIRPYNYRNAVRS